MANYSSSPTYTYVTITLSDSRVKSAHPSLEKTLYKPYQSVLYIYACTAEIIYNVLFNI